MRSWRPRPVLAGALLAAACSATTAPPRTTARAPSRPDPVAEAAARVLRLPDPRRAPLVVERRDGVVRAVWDAFRAEVRGDDVALGVPLGGAAITDVARDGGRWVFALDDGTVVTSETFLGPWTRVAAGGGPRALRRDAPSAALHEGRYAFIDEALRAWRFDGRVLIRTGPPWPAHALHLRFESARNGVMAVDGPRWLFTRDGGASWSLARAPQGCAALENPSAEPRVLRGVPARDGDDLLRCAPAPRPPPQPDAPWLRRRVAFALVAREPGYLPVLRPVPLDGETVAAFDGERLVVFDADTWRERGRVPTTWPAALELRGRLGDRLWGSLGDGGAPLRVGADGSSSRMPEGLAEGLLSVHRVGGPDAGGLGIAGLACRASTWREPDEPSYAGRTWEWLEPRPFALRQPCAQGAILYGDRVVVASESDGVRAWRVPGDAGEPDDVTALLTGFVEPPLRVTSDERYLYVRTFAGGGRSVAWGTLEESWRTATLPAGCRDARVVTPERLLAFADDRVLRTSDGGERWEPVVGARLFPGTEAASDARYPLCSSRYCQLSPSTVLAAPWGPVASRATEPAPPPAPAPPAQPRTVVCENAGRLPVPPTRGDPSWGEAVPGFLRCSSPPDAPVPFLANIAWAGADERGVFAVARDVRLPSRLVTYDVLRVARDEVWIGMPPAPGRVGATVRIGRAGPPRFVIPRDAEWSEATRWWAGAGCAGAGDAPARAWVETYDAAPREPRVLYARGGRCSVAVDAGDPGAVALHERWPSPDAAPERVSRPDFAAALPCRGPAAPGSTRWRAPGPPLEVPDVRDGEAVHMAEYESSAEGVCLRTATARRPPDSYWSWGAVAAAQPDGAMAGVLLVRHTLWRLRCAVR